MFTICLVSSPNFLLERSQMSDARSDVSLLTSSLSLHLSCLADSQCNWWWWSGGGASHNLSANLIKLLSCCNQTKFLKLNKRKRFLWLHPDWLVFQKEQLNLFLLDQKIVILTVLTVLCYCSLVTQYQQLSNDKYTCYNGLVLAFLSRADLVDY